MRHALFVAALAAVAAKGLQAQDGPYHFSKEISIGGEGGWDYLSVDPAAHRLYVSHATHIVVIDTQAGKVVGDIPDTPGVHGFAIASDLGRGFSSNGRENKVGIVDLKTLKLIQKVDTGENPDAILYEPARKEVYAFNGRGKSATVIDAQSGKVVATVPLEGKPESGQADSKAGKVYVNMEDLNAIKVIDTATHKVTETWPIAPGRGGDRHGVRRGKPSVVHRLRQQADAHGRQHERQDDLQRAGRRGRRFHVVRPRQQAGVHFGRRIGHGHHRPRGVANAPESGTDPEERGRVRERWPSIRPRIPSISPRPTTSLNPRARRRARSRSSGRSGCSSTR